MALFDGCGGRVRRVRRERGEVRSEEDGWVCLDGLNRRIAQKPACPPAGHLTSQTPASSLDINITHTHTNAHTRRDSTHRQHGTTSTCCLFFFIFPPCNRSFLGATRILPPAWVNALRSVAAARLAHFPADTSLSLSLSLLSLCISLALLVTYSTGVLPLKPAPWYVLCVAKTWLCYPWVACSLRFINALPMPFLDPVRSTYLSR